MCAKTQRIELQYTGGEVKPSGGFPSSAQTRQNTIFDGFFNVEPQKGHKRDTIDYAVRRMRPPSEPEINRTDPKKYFIEWNHDVPWLLWDKYAPRKRIRIKVYDIDNRLKDEARELNAAEQLELWKYRVAKLNYNPFEKELAKLQSIQLEKAEVIKEIEEIEEKLAQHEELTEEEKRKLTSIPDAFEKFMDSRRARKLEPESISAYQGCIDWIYEGLAASGYDHFKISELRHIHLSEALNYIAEDREWVATTINKGVEFMMTAFNWLETEEYIFKNPSKNKFQKLPTNKTKNKWYDRELKAKVKEALIAGGDDLKPLLHACEFTYFAMIRSKKEMRKLKVGDFDMSLQRLRFTADLSKTSIEAYRDIEPELLDILKEMNLSQYPANYYVFGSDDGTPGPKQCGHNYFSKKFFKIKEQLELSIDYTIYGFKHTRIVHLLMKGVDGYEISHKARHTDRKSTQDYMRDYDISLKNIYGPEDLTF